MNSYPSSRAKYLVMIEVTENLAILLAYLSKEMVNKSAKSDMLYFHPLLDLTWSHPTFLAPIPNLIVSLVICKMTRHVCDVISKAND